MHLCALPKVHAEIEALFDLERRTTDEQRATSLVRERLGEQHQSMFIDGAVDPEWPEYDDFQDLAEDVEHAVPKGVTRQLGQPPQTPHQCRSLGSSRSTWHTR